MVIFYVDLFFESVVIFLLIFSLNRHDFSVTFSLNRGDLSVDLFFKSVVIFFY